MLSGHCCFTEFHEGHTSRIICRRANVSIKWPCKIISETVYLVTQKPASRVLTQASSFEPFHFVSSFFFFYMSCTYTHGPIYLQCLPHGRRGSSSVLPTPTCLELRS